MSVSRNPDFTSFSALNPERQFLLAHIGFTKSIARAQGNYFYDTDGIAYLDFLAQYGAVPFGHNPPDLWERIKSVESHSAPALVQPLTAPAAEALAARLTELAPGPMRYVTFTNSGAETVEAAIKLARARTGRQGILSTHRGYHGKTLGALSATDNPAYRRPFLLDTQAFSRVPFNDPAKLEARLKTGDIAAFIVEPVQGEGGMLTPDEGYLTAASRLCRQYGTLLVLDEVQTGLGRTGRLFAAEHEPGLSPDILLLSKALGGGLVPLGAMLCTEAAWSEDFGFFHSSTFANNHLTCTVGLGVLDRLTENGEALVQHADAMGCYLAEGLDRLVAQYPAAYTRRTGRGLMQGLCIAPWPGQISYFLSLASVKGYSVPLLAGYLLNRHRVLTAPVINQSATLRLEPPLTVTQGEVDHLLHALERAGELMNRHDYLPLLDYLSHPEDADPPRPRQRVQEEDRPAPAVRKPTGKFAFLIHPTDKDVLYQTLPQQFGDLDNDGQARWHEWMASWFSRMCEPGTVFHMSAVESHAGATVEGWLIAAPLMPAQMMRLKRDEKQALMAAYLKAAADLDVDITGLGAFTSVITRGGHELDAPPTPLTSGNSLTAISSAESLVALMNARNTPPGLSRVAVIGAAGSIGRLSALHLAQHFGEMWLVGNPKNPGALPVLQAIAGEVYRLAATLVLENDLSEGLCGRLRKAFSPDLLRRLVDCIPVGDATRFRLEIESQMAAVGQPPLIQATTRLEQGLSCADAVLSASSMGKAFIDPALFMAGAVVCDVARPLDVVGRVRTARPDVLAYEGGIVRLPENIRFGAQNVLGYPRGFNLACLSETIVLAMEGCRRSFSIGNHLSYDEALWIYQRALAHGFSPAVLDRDGGNMIATTLTQHARAAACASVA